MSSIIVKPPTITENNYIRVATELVSPNGADVLWFEVDKLYASAIDVETLDAFMVSALLPAMRLGHDLRIEGVVSSKLFYNLTYSCIPLLRCLIPDLAPIRIYAEELTNKPVRTGPGAVVTGFSAGIDSFCTVCDHMPGIASEDYQLSHLLFNNSGSHGHAEDGRLLYHERLERLRRHAPLGLPMIAVNSNLDELIGLHFQRSHTIRNLAVALLLQKLVGKYLYSSGWSFAACSGAPSHDMAIIDPMMVHLLSTESLDCISSGSRYTRFEKTLCVAEFPFTYDALDVCIDPQRRRGRINCSVCSKCLRTQLSLDVAGKLHLFPEVFDLAAYEHIRFPLLVNVLHSKDPLFIEIREQFDAYRFQVPTSARLLAATLPRRLSYMLLARAIDEATRRVVQYPEPERRPPEQIAKSDPGEAKPSPRGAETACNSIVPTRSEQQRSASQ